MTSEPGYLAREPTNTEVYKEALRHWLPQRLAHDLTLVGNDRHDVARALAPMIHMGTPEFVKRTNRSGPRPVDYRSKYAVFIGRYCKVFSSDPWVVYNKTPWPFFILMLDEVTRARAEEEVQQLKLASLPHVKDWERRAAIEDMEDRLLAGVHPPTHEELAEEGIRNIEQDTKRMREGRG